MRLIPSVNQQFRRELGETRQALDRLRAELNRLSPPPQRFTEAVERANDEFVGRVSRRFQLAGSQLLALTGRVDCFYMDVRTLGGELRTLQAQEAALRGAKVGYLRRLLEAKELVQEGPDADQWNRAFLLHELTRIRRDATATLEALSGASVSARAQDSVKITASDAPQD